MPQPLPDMNFDGNAGRAELFRPNQRFIMQGFMRSDMNQGGRKPFCPAGNGRYAGMMPVHTGRVVQGELRLDLMAFQHGVQTILCAIGLLFQGKIQPR